MKKQYQLIEGSRKPDVDAYVIEDTLCPEQDRYKFYLLNGTDITEKVIEGEILIGMDDESYTMKQEPCRFSSNKKERELGEWLHDARVNGTYLSVQIKLAEHGYSHILPGAEKI